MKNICEETQMLIVSGRELTPAIREHLAECDDCRTFKSLYERLAEIPAPETDVPQAVDRQIREAAAERIHAASRWKLWKIALPAAACFMFCAAAVLFSGTGTARNSHETVEQTRDFEENLFNMSCEVGNRLDAVSETFDLMS